MTTSFLRLTSPLATRPKATSPTSSTTWCGWDREISSNQISSCSMVLTPMTLSRDLLVFATCLLLFLLWPKFQNISRTCSSSVTLPLDSTCCGSTLMAGQSSLRLTIRSPAIKLPSLLCSRNPSATKFGCYCWRRLGPRLSEITWAHNLWLRITWWKTFQPHPVSVPGLRKTSPTRSISRLLWITTNWSTSWWWHRAIRR